MPKFLATRPLRLPVNMNTRTPITATRRTWDFLQPALDAAAVLASLVVVKTVARGWIDDASLAMGLVAVVVFLLASQLTGLHRRFHSGNANDEMSSIVMTWSLTVFVLAVLAFATRYGQHFARSVMFGWIVLAPTLIGLSRMSLRIIQKGLLSRGVGIRRVAIAGLNELGRQTAANITEDVGLGLQVVGFFDDRIETRETESQESSLGRPERTC